MGRVVVGVDGSQQSKRALRRAVEEARLRNAELHAVFVFPPPHRPLIETTPAVPYASAMIGLPYAASLKDPEHPGAEVVLRAKEEARKELERVVDDALDGAARPPTRLVVIPDGHPAEALIDHAAGADLLVIGTRGHGGFKGMLLGSVAQQCVQHARCAVLVLPPNM